MTRNLKNTVDEPIACSTMSLSKLLRRKYSNNDIDERKSLPLL